MALPPTELWPSDGGGSQSPLGLASSGAANGASGSHTKALPAPLQLPEGSPIPLPIITPVTAAPDSGSPAAKRQLSQQLRESAAAAEAARSSPQGEVASTVVQL